MKTQNTMALLAIMLLSACGSDPVPVVNPNPGGFGPGGCVPINAQIGFTGTNNEFSYAQFKAGTIPATMLGFGSVAGTLAMGGGAAGGPYQRSGVDGTISMNIIPMGGAGGGSMGTQLVNSNGVLSISSITQSDILYQFTGSTNGFPGGGFPAPGQPGVPNPAMNVCVSGIAIDTGHYGYTLYNGNVYLYITVNGQPAQNGAQGYVLYF